MSTIAGGAPTTARRPGWLRRHGPPYLLSLPGGGWMIVFFLVPLVSALLVSLMTGNPVDGYTLTLNWHVYKEIFVHSPIPYTTFLVRALIYAVIATIVCIAIAYPMAYYVAFKVSRRWKSALILMLLLSFFVSFVIRTDMWSFVLSENGPLLRVLRSAHIVSSSFHILGTPAAVIFGDIYNNLAFMVLPIYVALERIDPRVLEASRDLYANGRQMFFRVVMPLSRAGLFAGILLVLITVAGDPVNASLLGGANTYVIGQAIQDAYLTTQQFNVAAALSTVLMVVLGVIMLIYARVFGTESIENLV
jgi:spermidine/putrescine transport system permease protein